MNYGKINKTDIANGEGVRVSLFVSGCRNHCKGCFNEDTWDFCYGEPFTKVEEDLIIEALKPNYINGLTILGGEPFEPENQEALVDFIKTVRKTYPHKTIWMYSGYTMDKDMLDNKGKVHTKFTLDILNQIDILVDGRFVLEKYNLALKFRGSENQRIILVQESLKNNEIVLSPLNEYKNFKPQE
ncbi:MAG: anaerobic ribonucleoside-triphosphate reductase activating protein [Acholeplasmatales bacterium]|nr:anaerobic ribonucleoside-triphosphate reductase activating protein [Acholeplasmatales bacterium]